MKRISLVFLVFLLCGCSRVGTTDTVEEDKQEVEKSIVSCTSENNEEYTFFSNDDEITSMQEIFYMSFEEAGIYEEMDGEQVKNDINQKLSEKYSSLEGVSAIVDEVVDYQIKIIFMVDFEVADMDQLIEAGLIEQGEVQSQYVSLKKTREIYVNNGFACEFK